MVEDDDMLRESINDYLTEAGHSVLGVRDAIQFYKSFSPDIFDIALVDINLPYSDGYSIVSYLRENTSIRIVITTVRAELEDRIKGYKSGVDIYLTKPLHPEELSAALFTLEGRLTSNPSADKKDLWKFNNRSLTLSSPDGASIPLSRKESMLINCLIHHGPGKKVLREEIFRFMGEAEGEGNRRNLDTLLSRLRNKIKGYSTLDFPLVTLQGYGFTLDVELEDEHGHGTRGSNEKSSP
ncbi:response regulator transcription factor [Hoeflea olei]|uniref:Two-component system response regulator n=1 Tax=Hoeflea olei TaxID=1480615 RepID=A0A1C1YVP2_9HYPH|nr:response regulator transcription factor [Hoeflea olei]OCW57430.1 hypothetical protein AWJ14_00855 [Hoeflea olei]